MKTFGLLLTWLHHGEAINDTNPDDTLARQLARRRQSELPQPRLATSAEQVADQPVPAPTPWEGDVLNQNVEF